MRRRTFVPLGALPLAALSGFIGAAPVQAATQCVNQNNPSPIEVCVRDDAQPGVWLNQGSRQHQYYSQYSWGSSIWLNGADTGSRYATPYLTGTAPTSVSNTTTGTGTADDPFAITTTSTLGDTGVTWVQRVSYVQGDRVIRKEWELTNNGSTTFEDLRFFHGGDTYFGGVDQARSWYSPSNSMVYVTNANFTSTGVMGFYPNPATPIAHYFSGYFSEGKTLANAGRLNDTANSTHLDAGYYLEWNRPRLAPGQTWVIDSYETWTAPGPVQVLAPANEFVTSKRTTVRRTFKVQNLSDVQTTTALNVTSSNADWNATIAGNASVTLDALAIADVEVDVEIPLDAADDSFTTVTLAADNGATSISAAARLTLMELNYALSTATVSAGQVLAGSTTDRQITFSNAAGARAVQIGDLASNVRAPWSIVSDTCSEQTIAADASCAVTLRYAPTAAGTHDMTLAWPIVSPVLTSKPIELRGSAEVPRYAVTAPAVQFGTISPASTNVTSGQSAAFTITPDTGYRIVEVTGCGGTLSGNTYTTDAITAACSIAASFAAIEPSFDASITTPISVSPASGNGTLPTSAYPQAVDYSGAPLTVTLLNPQTSYAPGKHVLTWRAVDSRGVETIVEQDLYVWPAVSMGKDVVLGYAQGNSGSFRISLNGYAPVYPFEVPYTVSTGVAHHDLEDGIAVFNQGEVEKDVYFAVTGTPPANATDQQVTVTLDDALNIGARQSLTVSFVTSNVPATVRIRGEQDGDMPPVFGRNGGPIELFADIVDPNSGDTHSIEWTAPTGADFTVSNGRLTLDPSSLPAGVHRIEVVITDNGSPAQTSRATIEIVIAPQAANLPSGASGWLDNGLPNHPDYSLPMRNVLPERAGQLTHYIVEADPGVSLALGPMAALAAGHQAEVDLDDSLGIEADSVENVGGYFDFVVNDLPQIGQSVNIVLPQRNAIPARPVYRKYDVRNRTWFTFVEDGNNAVASAPGTPGHCPPPHSTEYRNGLTPGDLCVRLTIEDGGPNDDDGERNGSISDPGGVGTLDVVVVTPPQPEPEAPAPTPSPFEGKTKSGGGSFNLLFGLAGAALWLVRRRRTLLACAMLPVASAASAGEVGSWYVAADAAHARSDASTRAFRNALAPYGEEIEAHIHDRERFAWRIRGGYQVNRFLAAEVGYTDLGDVSTSLSGKTLDVDALLRAASAAQPHSASGIEAAITARYVFDDGFALHARAGAFRWEPDNAALAGAQRIERDRSGTDVVYGVGAQYALASRWQLEANWARYRVESERIDTLGIGVRHSFR